jgi:pilus assembly protein CpaB
MTKKLLVAFGLAVIAVVSLYLYSRSLQEEVAGGQKQTVLVAAVEIPAGTRVAKSSLAQLEVPENYLHPGSIKKGEENHIIGRPVADRIKQGQPLLWSDFELQKSATTRRLSAAVQKGQRALTLPVDVSGSLAGMLRPGDHVDILGTFARGQGTDWATVTLLQNVLVIATGDLRATAEGEVDTSNGPRTFSNITVSVDLEEGELLAFAMQRGPVNVLLRAQDDLETVEDVPDKNFGDIFEVQKRAAFTRRHAQKKIEALKSQ